MLSATVIAASQRASTSRVTRCRAGRTQVAIEVEKVLNDLYPLLRAVQPADINATLNAIATALEGRGELIGKNLEAVDAYLEGETELPFPVRPTDRALAV